MAKVAVAESGQVGHFGIVQHARHDQVKGDFLKSGLHHLHEFQWCNISKMLLVTQQRPGLRPVGQRQ